MINIQGRIQAKLIDNNTLREETIHIKNDCEYQKNLTPQIFTDDIKNLLKNITSNLEIKYVSVSTAFDPPTKGQSVPTLEIGRVLPTITDSNGKLVYSAEFGNTVFTIKTNITSIVNSQNFLVNSVSGLQVGDRINVAIGGAFNDINQRKITAITGTQITVNSPFPINPDLGTNTCRQMISRLYLIYGNTATPALNTGKLCSSTQLITFKETTTNLYTKHLIGVVGT